MSAENLSNLNLLLEVPVSITARLGCTRRTIRDILQLKAGAVLVLEEDADAPICLYANERLIARGEVVAADRHVGVQITEVLGGSGRS